MKERGMSIAELLVVMFIFVLVGLALVSDMIFHQRSFIQENKRVLIKSQIRTAFIDLQEKISQAGAGIAVAGSRTYLGADTTTPFRGIIPLNSGSFNTSGKDTDPDGIIIAYGDVRTLTKISNSSWYPSNSTLVIDKVINPVSTTGESLWQANDIGMIMSKDGFYIFKVLSVNTSSASLTLRSTPVYYSGEFSYSDSGGPIPLSYRDFLPNYLNSTNPTAGNVLTYERDSSSVIKLNFFGIYFISRINGDYYLAVSLDTKGNANPCANGFDPEACVPLAKNIVDMQMEYIVPDSSTGQVDLYCTSSSQDPLVNQVFENPSFSTLYPIIILKQATGVKITISGVTERFREKFQNQMVLRAAGDRDSLTLTGDPWNRMQLIQLHSTFTVRNFFSVY